VLVGREEVLPAFLGLNVAAFISGDVVGEIFDVRR